MWGICKACRKETEAVVEDFGIGSFEFWGTSGFHRDEAVVSACCGAEVEGVTLDDLRQGYGEDKVNYDDD